MHERLIYADLTFPYSLEIFGVKNIEFLSFLFDNLGTKSPCKVQKSLWD